MYKFIVLLLFFSIIPFLIYADSVDTDVHAAAIEEIEDTLGRVSDYAEQNGYTKISRQELPDVFKIIFPHDAYFYRDDVYYYKKSINNLKAELVISPLYCGVDNTILVTCSNKDYSVSLNILEWDNKVLDTTIRRGYGGSYGLLLEPNSYDIVEKSIPNFTQRLSKETVLVIPVEINIYDVYVNVLTGGIFSIKNLRILDKEEVQKIVKDDSFLQIVLQDNIFKIVSNTEVVPRYLPIYTRSKDTHVNMRKEPNSKSDIVAQIVTFFPLDDRYIRDIYFNDEKECDVASCNYLHKGKNKEQASGSYLSYFDYGIDRYGTLFPYHTYTKDWYEKVSDFVVKNKQVKSIKLIQQVADRMFLEYDTEKIFLFTEGFPVNGWYKVFYITSSDILNKNDNRVYGYIHKSQLSWGY